MKKFACGILTGLGGTIAALAAILLAALFIAPERMPAPAITKVAQLDEKLRFIREHPEINPTMIAIGSSITWRQVSGAEMERVAGSNKQFLNAAGVYMRVHQTRKLARFLVNEYPRVRSLLVLTGLPDFEDCSVDKEPVFDRTGASLYAFERWPAALFYLRYFAPRRYLEAAINLDRRRTPFTGDLYMDEYGSGPVIVPAKIDLGLRYEAIDIDPFCVVKLAELSHDMTERGIHTMIVFPPIHPKYRVTYPDSTAEIPDIAASLTEKIRGDYTSVLVMHDDPRFGAEDFYDAFHLQWPAARRLSRIVADALSDVPLHNGKPRPASTPLPRPSAPGMSLGVPAMATQP